jgi:hypothetical protein
VFSCAGASATGFPLSKHWERLHCHRVVRPACLFTVLVGGGSSPLSSEVFLPLPLSEAFLLLLTGQCYCSCQPPCLFTAHMGSGSSLLSKASPLLVAGRTPCSRQRLSGPPGLFIYSPGKDSLPPIFSAQGAPPSFQRVLTIHIAYYSVSLFFPGGGQSVQGPMLLWPRLVCGGTAVPRSSPGLCLPKPYGRRPLAAPGALLVSPFNMKWRFSAPAGDVEGSKLCLFSVIMPAKCVSKISL